MKHTVNLFSEMPVNERGHGVLTPVVAMRGRNEEIIAVRQISLFKDELQVCSSRSRMTIGSRNAMLGTILRAGYNIARKRLDHTDQKRRQTN